MSSNVGYTKGPWNWDGNVWDYDPEQEAPWLVCADGAKILAGTIECPNEANARLIAAAPETWEMLNEVVNGGYLDSSPEQKRRVVDFLRVKKEAQHVI